jgi:hypothetical protein
MSLNDELKKVWRDIMNSQKSYKRLVDDLYEQEKPFEAVRENTLDNFNKELVIICKMIAHCLVLDSSEILYKYAIDLIRENPRRLSNYEDMNSYISAFQDKYESSTSISEKAYLWQLINELKIISGGDASTEQFSSVAY